MEEQYKYKITKIQIEYQWPSAKMVVQTLLEVKQHLCVSKRMGDRKVALILDCSIAAKSLIAGKQYYSSESQYVANNHVHVIYVHHPSWNFMRLLLN